jgi:hypothetical protein
LPSIFHSSPSRTCAIAPHFQKQTSQIVGTVRSASGAGIAPSTNRGTAPAAAIPAAPVEICRNLRLETARMGCPRCPRRGGRAAGASSTSIAEAALDAPHEIGQKGLFDPVELAAPTALERQQVAISHQRQVLGDHVGCRTAHVGQLTDGVLSLEQKLDEAQPDGVGEHAETPRRALPDDVIAARFSRVHGGPTSKVRDLSIRGMSGSAARLRKN